MKKVKKHVHFFKSQIISSHFAKYFVTGVTAFLIDTFVLNLIVFGVYNNDEKLFLGLFYISKLVAAICGATFSFVVNRYWTFGANGQQIRGQAVKMVFSFIFSLIYTTILYTVYFAFMQFQPILKDENLYPTIANVLTIGTAMFINFFVYKFFVFSHESTNTRSSKHTSSKQPK